MTTDSVDRDGDVVLPRGGEFSVITWKNPVVIFAHQHFSLPIGKCLRIWVAPDGHSVRAQIEFATRDVSEFADAVFLLCKRGFLRAVSIGFQILESIPAGQHFNGTSGFKRDWPPLGERSRGGLLLRFLWRPFHRIPTH